MGTRSDGDKAIMGSLVVFGIRIVSGNIGNRIVKDYYCGLTSVVRSSMMKGSVQKSIANKIGRA